MGEKYTMDVNGYHQLFGYQKTIQKWGGNILWKSVAISNCLDNQHSSKNKIKIIINKKLPWKSIATSNCLVTKLLKKWAEKYTMEVNGYQQLFDYQNSSKMGEKHTMDVNGYQ